MLTSCFKVVPGELSSRRIELRLPVAASGGGGIAGREEAVAGGFGLMFPPCEEGSEPGREEEPEEEDLTKGSVIMEEQLAANRIPERGNQVFLVQDTCGTTGESSRHLRNQLILYLSSLLLIDWDYSR